MAYAEPVRETIYLGLMDLAAGVVTTSFKGPNGLKGRLKDIIVVCTEVFNEVTSEAFIQLGTSGDADAYAVAGLGSTADTDTYRMSADDDAGDATTGFLDADLPADTQVEVVTIQNVGGTATGIGHVSVVVDWY